MGQFCRWITVVLFALMLGAFEAPDSKQSPSQQPASCQQNCQRAAHKDESIFFKIGAWFSDNHDAIEAISAIASVIFSAVLTASTIGLWSVTSAAANAAKRSADALPIVEQAYVYPIITSALDVAACIESAQVYYLDDLSKDDEPIPDKAEIIFRLKNYGKTPAILKAVFTGAGVGPIGAQIGHSIPEATLGSMEKTGDFSSQTEIGLTRKQARHILIYQATFRFEGTIIFDDIWGNEHTTEFVFVWDKDIQRMALRGVETKINRKAG